MAKREARFLTGLFVIVGLLTGAAAVVWVGASKYFEQGTQYVTYFDESVQGLQVDSEVKYRGVGVGNVKSIKVASDQKLVEVVIKIALEGDVEIRGEPGKGTALTVTLPLTSTQGAR